MVVLRRALVPAAAMAVALGSLGSCAPKLGECAVQCSAEGSCPDGFSCNSADNLCYRGSASDVVACADRNDAGTIDAAPPLRDSVDILFVIDNSASMADKQAILAAAMPQFVTALETAAGSLPDMHVGVVSTDMGAGAGAGSFDCNMLGDNGVLLAMGTGTCAGPDGSFLSDVDDGDGGRQINYTGTLADTLTCMIQVGASGCSFEQPLASMRRALDGTHPANDGFRRPGAALAVVFLTDEDDCSASTIELFDPNQTTIDSELGPFTSYRCFEFGVVCDPDDRTAVGARQECAAREDSPYLVGIPEYAEFLTSLAPREHLVVAGVFGPAAPVAVSTSTTGNPSLDSSCFEPVSLDSADPAVRLQALLDVFHNRLSHDICDTDLTQPIDALAELIADALP